MMFTTFMNCIYLSQLQYFAGLYILDYDNWQMSTKTIYLSDKFYKLVSKFLTVLGSLRQNSEFRKHRLVREYM